MEAGRSESIKDTIWFLGKGIACLGEKENIRSPRMGNRRFNCTRGWTYWDTQYCDSVWSVLLSAGLTDRRWRLIFRDLKFSMTTRLLFALFCVVVNALKAKHVAHANECSTPQRTPAAAHRSFNLSTSLPPTGTTVASPAVSFILLVQPQLATLILSA
jgi:hypothetical protein